MKSKERMWQAMAGFGRRNRVERCLCDRLKHRENVSPLRSMLKGQRGVTKAQLQEDLFLVGGVFHGKGLFLSLWNWEM